MKSKLIFATAYALASAARLSAGTITFEAAPVTQDAGSFYQGVTFSGDVVINASSAFPDASTGSHVLQGTGSDIVLNFTSPQTSVSFFYSTFFTLTATAYDAMGHQVGLTFTGPQNTDALNTGVASLASITGAGIVKVDINGQFGDFYDIDNVTAPGVSGLPAPDATGTFALLGVAAVGLFSFRRKLAV